MVELTEHHEAWTKESDSPMDFLPCGLRLSSVPSGAAVESAVSSLVEPVWKRHEPTIWLKLWILGHFSLSSHVPPNSPHQGAVCASLTPRQRMDAILSTQKIKHKPESIKHKRKKQTKAWMHSHKESNCWEPQCWYEWWENKTREPMKT